MAPRAEARFRIAKSLAESPLASVSGGAGRISDMADGVGVNDLDPITPNCVGADKITATATERDPPSAASHISRGGNIDMDVFRHLPADIQRELAAAYNITLDELGEQSLTSSSSSLSVPQPWSGVEGEVSTELASPPQPPPHEATTVKVSKGVTVDSIISQRVKAKERQKRESSGMHLYFQKKSS
jgi:hypothetical protein